MYEDHHTSRDETLVTRVPPHVELSASAQARADYKTPMIVLVWRWIMGPFREDFDHDRRGTTDRRKPEQRVEERRGALPVSHRKGDR